MPQLGDPNFHRSVVLMIEHSASGAMGLVLNRASPVTLRELAEGQSLPLAKERGSESVFIGGPVEPQRGFALHDDATIAEKTEVVPGFFLSVTLEALGPLLSRPRGDLRFCLGYAGWGPQQLESEIRAGSWLVADAKREALSTPAEQLWDATVRGMGFDPAMLLMGMPRGVH